MLSDGAVGVHVSRALPWGARVVKAGSEACDQDEVGHLGHPNPLAPHDRAPRHCGYAGSHPPQPRPDSIGVMGRRPRHPHYPCAVARKRNRASGEVIDDKAPLPVTRDAAPTSLVRPVDNVPAPDLRSVAGDAGAGTGGDAGTAAGLVVRRARVRPYVRMRRHPPVGRLRRGPRGRASFAPTPRTPSPCRRPRLG